MYTRRKRTTPEQRSSTPRVRVPAVVKAGRLPRSKCWDGQPPMWPHHGNWKLTRTSSNMHVAQSVLSTVGYWANYAK